MKKEYQVKEIERTIKKLDQIIAKRLKECENLEGETQRIHYEQVIHNVARRAELYELKEELERY